MGDPKKQRKRFSKPRQLWQIERLEREKKIVKKYGLKNMQELWRMESLLRNFRRRARKLLTLETPQAEIEKKQLLGRLSTLNILKKDASIDDVLSTKTEDLLERRLQTTVQKKGLANTSKQARQFIVHGHIAVGGNKVTAPGYLVKTAEEKDIKLRSPIDLKTKPVEVPKTKPVETKPAETKETKPAETKPIKEPKTKPAETKETKLAETKPIKEPKTKPAEVPKTKPVETKETKPIKDPKTKETE